MFEKTFKVFAAMLAFTNPIEPRFTQDFLLDTGAGRSLISFKGMPDTLKEHVTEAPEKVRFATGLKAINLQGSSSGKNTFYALKDCPAALSVGIQVNEHRRPFVWMPDQLPFMVKADRVGEMVMHVPESAKIYADRVDQNVPILSETIQVHAMPFSEGGSSGSGIRREWMERVPEAPPPPEPPPLPPPPEPPPEPVHPDDLPRSKKPLKLKEKVPHFGSVSEVDELFASVPEREPGDTALDSEDEELHPWTPSLRQKLELQVSSLNHQLTHFPKNR